MTQEAHWGGGGDIGDERNTRARWLSKAELKPLLLL